MNDRMTELVFVLDKSGSMSGLESDTIGGFNAMLLKQGDIAGQCRITTVLFDHHYELLHDRIDISAVDPITKKDYQVGQLLYWMRLAIQSLKFLREKNIREESSDQLR